MAELQKDPFSIIWGHLLQIPFPEFRIPENQNSFSIHLRKKTGIRWEGSQKFGVRDSWEAIILNGRWIRRMNQGWGRGPPGQSWTRGVMALGPVPKRRGKCHTRRHRTHPGDQPE